VKAKRWLEVSRAGPAYPIPPTGWFRLRVFGLVGSYFMVEENLHDFFHADIIDVGEALLWRAVVLGNGGRFGWWILAHEIFLIH